MTTAKTVYTSAPPEGTTGTLFEGRKFWLSYNVPQRSRFRELIQYNGGFVVPLEKDADIKLVDHAKKDVPPDSFSYQYIEKSIRAGGLVSLEAHRVGPAEAKARPVGASHISTRAHRTQFTKEDDEILLAWVRDFEAQGGATAGNKIYESLAQKHPQHTSQSWRNRYVKNFRGQRPPAALSSATQRVRTSEDTERTSPRKAISSGAPTREQPEVSQGSKISKPVREDEVDRSSQGPSHSASKLARRQHLDSLQHAPSTPVDQLDEFLTQIPRRSPHLQPQTPNLPQQLSGDGQQPPVAARPNTISSPKRDQQEHAQQDVAPMEGQEARKRRRVSVEIPTFGIELQPERKRRAIDFDPRALPSTPIQPPVEAEKEDDRPALESTDDETQSEDEFETAPQFGDTQRPMQPDDNLLRELPFLPSSPSEEETRGQEREEEIISEIDQWINSRVRTGKAQNEQQVIEALRCTSMDPDLADVVLKYLVKGKGVPQHIRGVWTAEDDRRLQNSNSRETECSIEKHGMELAKIRQKYLRMAQSAGI